MKKLFIGILLFMGLVVFNSEIYASPSPGISYEKTIEPAHDKSTKVKKNNKNRKDREKMGKASRKESIDGKKSRIKAKDGKKRRN